jgi:predicted phosphoadenosine phosphosulfate sulfurtransferase
MPKKYLDQDVYEAALDRTKLIFEEFKKVYFSFSGGKDSSVMIHLAFKIAKEMDRLPLNILFVDLEGNYKTTVDHVEEILLRDNVNAYWICLPLHLRNAVSMFQPQWVCWDPDEKKNWIRSMPDYDCVISDPDYFNFFQYGMEFEDFVVEFGEWLSEGEKTACCVAIRSDESLNRFRTIANKRKVRFQGKGWTTKVSEHIFNCYPIYDWRVEDIWTAVAKFNWSYNKLYDLMYKQGRSIHQMRICQPYGDDQRKGLDLFHECEPETWSKIVNRVSGANMGSIYRDDPLLGNRRPKLPKGHTWKSYVDMLLKSLPRYTAEIYLEHFKTFRDWWEDHGYPIEEWPDKGPAKLEARKKIPSWHRLAKCILKNDLICKSLSFSQTKNQFEEYNEIYEKYKGDDNRNELTKRKSFE